AWVAADPGLNADDRDVPFIGHTGIIVVQRRSDAAEDQWYSNVYAPTAVAVDGIHAICSYASILRPGLQIDVILIEGDAATVQSTLTAAINHPNEPIVEAAFELIAPLRYPWAGDFVGSALPQTVG
ncbi:MAG TPA: hypothetical protein PKV27_09080, partial [Ilumatobacteraceae bacterium]|nr:hypothetical protein [Ilumatobacteraceae bacterium]